MKMSALQCKPVLLAELQAMLDQSGPFWADQSQIKAVIKHKVSSLIEQSEQLAERYLGYLVEPDHDEQERQELRQAVVNCSEASEFWEAAASHLDELMKQLGDGARQPTEDKLATA